jgi:mRNA interferase MazF
MNQENKLNHFIEWTKIKIRIHVSERVLYFKQREIWWASLGCNIGHEEDGKNIMFERPVLIVKKFNHHLLWVLPLTS